MLFERNIKGKFYFFFCVSSTGANPYLTFHCTNQGTVLIDLAVDDKEFQSVEEEVCTVAAAPKPASFSLNRLCHWNAPRGLSLQMPHNDAPLGLLSAMVNQADHAAYLKV